MVVSKAAFGHKFIIGNVYLPHEGSPYHQNELFDDLSQDLLTLNAQYGLPIVLIGDFNARTGLVSDFIEIDKCVAEICGVNTTEDEGFCDKSKLQLFGIETRRFNNDKTVNNNGYKLMDLCRNHDLKIVNGRFGLDSGLGEYTRIKPNGSSIVDYAITSTSLLQMISFLKVDLSDKCLSDVHCPINLNISFKCHKPINDNQSIDIYDENLYGEFNFDGVKNCWTPEHCKLYPNAFEESILCSLEETIGKLDAKNTTQADMNNIASLLNEKMIDSAITIGACKKMNNKAIHQPQKKRKLNKPWFDINCETAKKEYSKVLKRYKSRTAVIYQAEVINKYKAYKRTIRKASNKYHKSLHNSMKTF